MLSRQDAEGAQAAAAGPKDQGEFGNSILSCISELLVEACEGHSETSSSPQEEDVLEQPCGLDMLLRGKEQDQKTERDH